MSDPVDTRLRELTYRLIEMAPEAPRFPEEPMVQLKPAPSPTPAPRRRRPASLVVAAAVAAFVIVGVPLLVFGPGGDPAPTTVPPATVSTVPDTVTTTEPPSTPTTATTPPGPVTTVTQPPSSFPPTLVPGAASFDVDPSAVIAVPSAGTIVVNAAWGTDLAQLGRDDVKGFGPCCFDVTADGSIVLLDNQNQRLMLYPTTGVPRLLATFDPTDFVPENLAVDADRVHVVGLTNRVGGPYDLMVLDLATGAELSRTQTSLDINTDLRVGDSGDVYAGVMSSQPTWVRLTENGEPLGAGNEQRYQYLPGESSVAVTYDDGIEIIVQPAGDSSATTFDVPTDRFVLDVIPVPGAPDANGVLVPLTASLGADEPVLLLVIGSDGGNLSAKALSIDMPRDVELGVFNTIRYGFGGVYVMSSTNDGLQITRYELP